MTTNATNGLTVKPASWDETRALFRDRFDSGKFWLAVFDSDSMRLLHKIEEAHYGGPATFDLDVAIVNHLGTRFIVAAMRKTRMPAWKYRSLLRQFRIELDEPELIQHDCVVIVTEWRMNLATGMIERLLSGQTGLAMAA